MIDWAGDLEGISLGLFSLSISCLFSQSGSNVSWQLLYGNCLMVKFFGRMFLWSSIIFWYRSIEFIWHAASKCFSVKLGVLGIEFDLNSPCMFESILRTENFLTKKNFKSLTKLRLASHCGYGGIMRVLLFSWGNEWLVSVSSLLVFKSKQFGSFKLKSKLRLDSPFAHFSSDLKFWSSDLIFNKLMPDFFSLKLSNRFRWVLVQLFSVRASSVESSLFAELLLKSRQINFVNSHQH